MTKTDLSRICMAAAALLAAGTVTASEPEKSIGSHAWRSEANIRPK